ncbi:GNAT family N-acetyltransferase [bacterium]|nr:GNAT family N-acetyltransferase [bacterium]
MNQDTQGKQLIPRALGDGLILRQATTEDTEELAAFNAEIHNHGAEEPNEFMSVWTRDLMSGKHPTVDVNDFTVVEDTCAGKIVSSLNLISQTWSYGGIKFGVGRPELVGTHPDYRNRGLIRAQFEVVHAWSLERGEKLQAITGIPYFYRQFGYEMGLDLGGEREGYKSKVPKLKNNEAEPYRVRPATEIDLPFITKVYEQAMQRYLVTCIRDEVLWRYELNGHSQRSTSRMELCVVENAEEKSIGFLVHPPNLWGGKLEAIAYELEQGISWLAVTPTAVRYLLEKGKEYAKRDQKEEPDSFQLGLGIEHPAYQVINDWIPRIIRPYAWYVRVPDLPDFLQHVACVLEQRLAESALVGHTGELKINFYRNGLRLAFEKGRLTQVDLWKPTDSEEGSAAFPDLTFLQLLFGYRSLEELDYAFADCWTKNDEAQVLLKILFPKQPSFAHWPVG